MSREPSSEKPKADPNVNVIEVPCAPGEDVELATARVCIGPYAANALAIKLFAKGSTGGDMPSPAVVKALREASKRVRNDNMKDVEAMLVTQAMTLNVMFADLSRRSVINLGDGSYFNAGERYFKMAMKAQNQCRMTLETLSAIKNPPVVYAKQANIAHGPQQVNIGRALRARKKIEMSRTNFWSKAMKSPWTQERRARQSEAIHRWQPWIKSTGPRTTEGKAIISRNAFKGGERPLLRKSMREFRQFMRAAGMALDEAGG